MAVRHAGQQGPRNQGWRGVPHGRNENVPAEIRQQLRYSRHASEFYDQTMDLELKIKDPPPDKIVNEFV